MNNSIPAARLAAAQKRLARLSNYLSYTGCEDSSTRVNELRAGKGTLEDLDWASHLETFFLGNPRTANALRGATNLR